MIPRNDHFFSSCSRDLSSQTVAKAAWGSEDAHIPSITTCRPRPQAVRAHGAPHLPFGFASKPSPNTPWARGLLLVFWEWGYPDLPACGPWRGSIDGLVRPSFDIDNSRPSRGGRHQDLHEEQPPQVGSRGAEISMQVSPREAKMT